MFKALFLYNIVLVVAMAFLALFSFYAGLRLLQGNPKAVKTGKAFFITQLMLTLIIIVSRPLIDFPLGGHGLILGELLQRLIPAVLNFSLWYFYLSYSKRVHNTYSESGKQQARLGQFPVKLVGHTELG